MDSPPQLSLVIPHYNEADRLHLMEEGLAEMAQASGEYNVEVLLVDDGSKDATWEGIQKIASEFANKHGKPEGGFQIRCLQQLPNGGKGVALQKGIQEAKGNWILTLDADMAAHPEELLKWQDSGKVNVNAVDVDMVSIGSREHPESTVIDPSGRRFMGHAFNLITRLLSGLPMKDTQCGFKLYPAGLAKEVFAELVNTGWAHDVEVLMRIRKRGIPIQSLPIHWKAVDGSKVNPLTDSFKMFFALLEIRRAIRREG